MQECDSEIEPPPHAARTVPQLAARDSRKIDEIERSLDCSARRAAEQSVDRREHLEILAGSQRLVKRQALRRKADAAPRFGT